MASLGLDDLVANGTMSRGIAATLRRIGEGRRSYLVIALPRMAGKSTVGKAILDVAKKSGAVVRELGVDGTDVASLAREARGGYLYVPEVSRFPVTEGYVWGAPVRAAFAEIKDGTSLSTALHADSPQDALDILRQNRIADADLGRLEAIVHIRSLGEDWRNPTRRVIAGVFEMQGGEPIPLHIWDSVNDRFEEVAKPKRI
jgi:type IV secretory pathway ATPase VirB11/archaellum biosynthesis ATPase